MATFSLLCLQIILVLFENGQGQLPPIFLSEFGSSVFFCRRLEKNWNSDMIGKLCEDQPQLAESNNLDVFKRKWQYMFVYAEIGYAKGYTSMHYFTFARPVCGDFLVVHYAITDHFAGERVGEM